jgi:hypothetical protein
LTEDDLPLAQKVARWVKVSGRGIEMETAHAARDAGARTALSVPYTDVREGKRRETDVLAVFEGFDGPGPSVTLVIECKRAPGKHWATRLFQEPYTVGLWAHTLNDRRTIDETMRVDRAWAGVPGILDDGPQGSGLNEVDMRASAGERDKEVESGDLAAKALRQVWSASEALLVNTVLTERVPDHGPFTNIVIPVIVTGAGLWECRLDDDGQPTATRVDYTRVLSPAFGDFTFIHVMNLDRFRRFAQQVAALQKRKDPDPPARRGVGNDGP